VGGLVAALGLSETLAEVRPYVVSGIAAEQRFHAVAGEGFTPAGSRWSRNLYFDDCVTVPYTEYALAQAEPSRQAFAANCIKHAREVVADAPTAANAWLAMAYSYYSLGQVDAATDALSSAFKAAMQAQGPATRRIWLAERMFDQLDDDLLQNYRADLRTAAQVRSGLTFLADRYVRNPARRDEYISAVEEQGPRQQAQFLREVKAKSEAPS